MSIWLGLCLLCLPGICADVTGTVRVSLDSAPPAPPEKRPPAGSASVTLCSTERAYRVEADQEGRFHFAAVQPGTYDLVAVSIPMTPTTVSKVKVSENESASPLTVLVPGTSRNSPCWVNSKDSTMPFDFDINYQAPEAGRTAPVVRGEAGRWTLKHPNSPVVVKPLAQAHISLFRAGEKTPLMSTVADNKGRFEFYPEPGIYELQVSHTGYQDAHVPAFLVPRESVTLLPVSLSKVGTVVITQ